MPLVSVVIPAFNAEGCLRRAVDSVLAQGFQDFEIVIVDDASRDATLALANSLAANDSRIRVLHQLRNQGQSVARNVGFSNALGEWVAVLDADDMYGPDRLTHLLDLASRRGADMVADNLTLFDVGANRYLPPAFDWSSEHELNMDLLLARDVFLKGPPLGWIKPMWRRAFLNDNHLEYPPRYRFGEDYYLLAATLLCGASAWLSPKADYTYTLSTGPISGKNSPFSRTRFAFRRNAACCRALVRRYGDAMKPHQVMALEKRQRTFMNSAAMFDVIRAVRRKEIVRATGILLRKPVAAGMLATLIGQRAWSSIRRSA